MKMLRITLEGKSYDVGVEILDEPASVAAPFAPVAPPRTVKPAPVTADVAVQPVVEGCTAVICPMAGLVFKRMVKPGDVVTLNQVVIVLDAMKMETPVYAPVAGTVRSVLVKEGDAVDEGHVLLQIEG